MLSNLLLLCSFIKNVKNVLTERLGLVKNCESHNNPRMSSLSMNPINLGLFSLKYTGMDVNRFLFIFFTVVYMVSSNYTWVIKSSPITPIPGTSIKGFLKSESSLLSLSSQEWRLFSILKCWKIYRMIKWLSTTPWMSRVDSPSPLLSFSPVTTKWRT